MTIKSKYFSRAEFACHCGCGFDTIDAETLRVLEELREHFGAPVKITSAARCLTHNENEGSTSTSQHVLGRACDIQVRGVAPDEVADVAEAILGLAGGVGRYKTFTHIDTRMGCARWG